MSRALIRIGTMVLLVVLLGLSPGTPQARGDDLADALHLERSSYGGTIAKYHLMERVWLPAQADGQTVGLYRLDAHDASSDVNAILDEAMEPKSGHASSEGPPEAAPEAALGGAPESPAQGSSNAGSPAAGQPGLELRDSTQFNVKRPAHALGGSAFVDGGKFGGALRLSGDKSAIKLPQFPFQNALTIEAWVKPEKLGGTLLAIPATDGGPLWTLNLTPAGQLTLLDHAAPVQTSALRLEAGRFVHVAFVCRERLPQTPGTTATSPRDCVVFINGRPALGYDGAAYIEAFRKLSQPILLGNTPTFDAPFVGLIDELRISTAGRDYYPLNDQECDGSGARPIPDDQPILRGREEVLLHAPFDGSLAPSGAFAVTPVPPQSKGDFAPAMHGQGLIVSEKKGVVFTPLEEMFAGQGSVEFWYSPHDWDNRRTFNIDNPAANFQTPMFQLLVSSDAAKQALPFITMRIDQTSETKGVLKEYYLYPQEPGTWHHAVVTWQGQEARLFIDGREYDDLGSNHPAFIVALDRRVVPQACRVAGLAVGGFSGDRVTGSTIIDEVRLYRHRLTPREVSNAYQRFLRNPTVQALPPVDLAVNVNSPLHQMTAALELLMPERQKIATFDLKITMVAAPPPEAAGGPSAPKASGATPTSGEVVEEQTGVALQEGSRFIQVSNPRVGYGDYLFSFRFKDAGGNLVTSCDVPHTHARPAWVDSGVGLHDGQVMPPWTPMGYQDGTITCWGRAMSIDATGWPSHIVSQGQAIMPGPPKIQLATDRGDITLSLVPGSAPGTTPGTTPGNATVPTLLKKQDDVVITQGVAKGGGWTMTTTVRAEFDGLMKIQTRFDGPPDAQVRRLSISFPLAFGTDQLLGFYTGEHWFRAADDYRLLPQGEGVVFSSNNTGRQHPSEWAGKVSFLPYVTVGDDSRSFCWFSENDRNWTQSWANPSITIVRHQGMTILNLNLITEPCRATHPLEYTFGVQATPVRPLAPDARATLSNFGFEQVCGFNGYYLQAPFENHMAFRLAPKEMNWGHAAETAATLRKTRPGAPVMMYLDRLWTRAPDDALEYNRDWRGWGDGVRYTRPVRDCYAWYISQWLAHGVVDGIYIDDAWIDPTKSLWHIDPGDNLSYKKEGGSAADFSDREWGFEFFDYREMLKRIRWAFLDNHLKPRIVAHATQTCYYPMLGFVDVLLEGEDRYLAKEGEPRDFISSWGMERLRYSSPAKWGVAAEWLPILSNKLKSMNMPMEHWYFRQHRAYLGGLLAHDISPEHAQAPEQDIARAGCYSDQAAFIGYWEAGSPVAAREKGFYASVYRLPTHLALVLVNATGAQKVTSFTLDPARVKALLGCDGFTIKDVDSGTIPPPDKEFEELSSGVKMKALEAGIPGAGAGGKEGDPGLGAKADDLINELDTAEKKQKDPDGFFEYHNFKYEGGVLRLRIQGDDYRLLEVVPEGSPKGK